MKYKILLPIGIMSCSIAFANNNTTTSAEIQTNLEATDEKTVHINEAKQVIGKFVKKLKGELQKAMAEGGPVNAITVCNEKAASITHKISEEEGVTVSRVSLKNRNPLNHPNEWQKKILEGIEIKKSEGVDVKTIAFADIIEEGDKKQFRFMKAIPTGKLCLVCHGEKLIPEVANKLSELYPDDKATGFKEGDIRGAFVIVKDLTTQMNNK